MLRFNARWNSCTLLMTKPGIGLRMVGNYHEYSDRRKELDNREREIEVIKTKFPKGNPKASMLNGKGN